MTARGTRHTLFFFTLSLSIVLLGCQERIETSAVIWTNRPEFAAYVERYNAANDLEGILIEYKENPAAAFRAVGPGKDAPDIVIAEGLTSRELLNKFATLESLFNEGKLDAGRFYADPLSQGVYEDQHVLLPVSFDLPLIVFDREKSPEELSPFFIEFPELRDLSVEFNEQDEHGLVKLGYSPFWEKELLFVGSQLAGAGFRETSSSLPVWNGSKVQDSLDFFRAWTEEGNGGIEEEDAFSRKFLYEPPYMLIEKGRIRFYYHDINSFFSIPAEKRSHLDYRWPAKNEKIPVQPPLLYLGIPHGAPGIATAKDFISWFFRAETQQELLSASEYKRIRGFGIAGGFSTLPQVNEEIMPRMYPFLLGHIPKEGYLSFPESLPLNWRAIQKQVIEPWLLKSLRRPGEGDELSSEIEKWFRQRPE
jgi:hypothetical protein